MKKKQITSSMSTNSLYNNETKYVGEIVDGYRHLKGKLTWSNGDVYEGSFKEGMRSGYGEFIYKKNNNEFMYKGNWKNSMRNGYGIETGHLLGTKCGYEGDWKDDKYHGIGSLKIPKAQYAGEFVDGIKHGHGFILFENGETYEGQFKSGRFDGFGENIFFNGERYQGQFKNGLKHGRGTYFYSNGNEFIGFFPQGKRHGRGLLRLEDGRVRNGEWENNALKKRIMPIKSYEYDDFSANEYIKNLDLKPSLTEEINILKDKALYRASFHHSNHSRKSKHDEFKGRHESELSTFSAIHL